MCSRSLSLASRSVVLTVSQCYLGHFSIVPRSFSTCKSLPSEPDFEAARKWYSHIQGAPIASNIGEVSYSRSSGPGGQNVNKVNSKAQLRVSIEQLLPLLPGVLHDGIKASRFYAEKTATLLIQSDESRKQSANRDTCYRRLNELVLDIYRRTVPGETSPEQRERVKQLQKAENESRLRLKKHISSKKAARRGGDD